MFLAPYPNRFARPRPLVVVLAHNAFTEITDFMIPFGVLSRSGAAEVVALATGPGPVNFGTLKARLPHHLEGFDRVADYLVVPAMMPPDHPPLVDWVAQQARRGAILVSICLGATVVAHSGCLNGRKATSYFGGYQQRAAQFPEVHWQKNIRYVQDGDVISSAGISASLPLSLALVEVLGGSDKAAELARELEVDDWSPAHDSDSFRPDEPVQFLMPGPEDEPIGIRLHPGVDEVSLGLTVDAYCHTGKTRPYLLAESMLPVRSRHGLEIFPDQVNSSGSEVFDRPVSFAKALSDIRVAYGDEVAATVARIMEYPQK